MKNMVYLFFSLVLIMTGCRFGNFQEWQKDNCIFYGSNCLDGEMEIIT
jgi:hypothetical protein